MQGLQAASAQGVTLYGGKFTMDQADATLSGPVFKMAGGDALAAIGVDKRTEKYKFDGNNTANTNDISTWIFNAPFDNINALSQDKRDINAVYGELMLPILKQLEVTLSARHDEYTGFGSTNNPKVSFKFTPLDSVLLRGSYSTGFRVPTFNQLFNGPTDSPYTGAGVADPAKCATPLVTNATPGSPCAPITFNTLFGGKKDLGPEKAKMATLGLIWQPVPDFNASLDFWTIKREGTIQSLGVTGANGFIANYNLFQDRFLRNANGDITYIDTSWINAGETKTKGLEFALRGAASVGGDRITAGLDVSYLLGKKSRLIKGQPFGASEVGRFTRSDDLGIRWKHSVFVTYTHGDWSGTLTQIYRGGYTGYVPPGVAAGYTPARWNPEVDPYWLHHVTVTYTGYKDLKLSVGVKNIFDTKPPFANSYDTNTGSGSSWEPRVADPRLRSLLLQAEYTFF